VFPIRRREPEVIDLRGISRTKPKIITEEPISIQRVTCPGCGKEARFYDFEDRQSLACPRCRMSQVWKKAKEYIRSADEERHNELWRDLKKLHLYRGFVPPEETREEMIKRLGLRRLK
jgi:uncharacterized C2H2 Zn-finger protein